MKNRRKNLFDRTKKKEQTYLSNSCLISRVKKVWSTKRGNFVIIIFYRLNIVWKNKGF